MPKDILKGLSKDKIPVIKKTKGPCLVLAGAGTGKTMTIVAKIAYLINNGVAEDRIICLTFSNNAATSLKEKVNELMGYESLVRVQTFHGYCNELLREHGERVGVPYGFRIINETDAMMVLYHQGLEPREAKFFANTIMKAKDLYLTINDYKSLIKELKAKLELISPDVSKWDDEFKTKTVELRTLDEEGLSRSEKSARKRELNSFLDLYKRVRELERLVNAWVQYEQYTIDNGLLDYPDLNLKVLNLLNEVSDDFLSKSVDYVIVDEFQDTSYVQFELLKRLVNDDHDVTVVGDANQTIYAFRGAFVDNIEFFRREFKVSKGDEFRLINNFRSTQPILDVSYELIKHNYDDESQVFKLVNPKKTKGEPVRVIECLTGEEEARRVVELIDEQVKNDISLSDIAVLYRSHSHGLLVRRLLENRGYPTNVSGGTDVLSQPEVVTVISFLEIMANFEKPYFKGDQAWWRILHTKELLNPVDSIKLAEYTKKKQSIQRVLYEQLDKVGLSTQGVKAINELKDEIKKLRAISNLTPSLLIIGAYKLLGIINKFANRDDLNATKSLINLKDFYKLAESFEKNHSRNIIDFVEYIRLIDELGSDFKATSVKAENSINLMTIHASKGLEFPVVILINMVQNRFPLTRGGKEALIPPELHPQLKKLFKNDYDDKTLEKELKELKRELKLREERKLCYVALTRAKNKLLLTHAQQYNEGTLRRPSEFINEMGEEILLEKDEQTTSNSLMPDTDIDRFKNQLRNEIIKGLDSKSISELTDKLIIYQSISKPELLSKLPKKQAVKLKELINKSREYLDQKAKFDPSKLELSYSSISTYKTCPKKFYLSRVLRMPGIWDEKNTGAMNRGTFVHEILEQAVNKRIKTKKELFNIKDELLKKPEFKGVNLEGVDEALEVFWFRNNAGFKNNISNEYNFKFNLNGFNFTGKIDRLDKLEGNSVHIIDYKTGGAPSNDKMFLQLGLYALAVMNDQELRKYNPKLLSLQLLEEDKDKTYELIGDELVMKGARIKPRLSDIKQEIIKLAEGIKRDFTDGFKRTKDERECNYCEFKFYCK